MMHCPRCGSPHARANSGYLFCAACGHSESLIDFPVSWDWYRMYTVRAGLPDPGPSTAAPAVDLDGLRERLEAIEDRLSRLDDGELRSLRLGQLRQEIQDLRQGLRYTQRAVARHPGKRRTTDAGKAPGKPILTEL